MLDEAQIKLSIRDHYSQGRWRSFSKFRFELSINGLINMLKYLELQHVKKLVSDFKRKVLDVGCGRGEILNLIPDADLYGIDISKKMVTLAKKHTCAKISIGDATKLKFKGDFFDNLICIDTLHHLPEKSFSKALSEFVRVTKSGSTVILDFKNSNNFLIRFLHKRNFNETYYCTDYTFNSIKKILGKHNLEVVHRYGVLAPSIIAPYVILECLNVK
jgi:ubiquinone/menaquinone biosynthesis C-methylase UbiE